MHCGAISRAVCIREGVMNCVMWLNLLSFAHIHSVDVSRSPLDGNRSASKVIHALNTADAAIGRNALPMPRVSKQRSAGASDPNDSAHQVECECYSGRRPVRLEMRSVHCGGVEVGFRRVEPSPGPACGADYTVFRAFRTNSECGALLGRHANVWETYQSLLCRGYSCSK